MEEGILVVHMSSLWTWSGVLFLVFPLPSLRVVATIGMRNSEAMIPIALQTSVGGVLRVYRGVGWLLEVLGGASEYLMYSIGLQLQNMPDI